MPMSVFVRIYNTITSLHFSCLPQNVPIPYLCQFTADILLGLNLPMLMIKGGCYFIGKITVLLHRCLHCSWGCVL